MFYTINQDTEQILNASQFCPDPAEEAEDYHCPIYIIEGEHTGLSAKYSKDGVELKMKVKPGDVVTSEFGTGKIMTCTKQWIIHQTGIGEEEVAVMVKVHVS